jgi:hypothetical protein
LSGLVRIIDGAKYTPVHIAAPELFPDVIAAFPTMASKYRAINLSMLQTSYSGSLQLQHASPKD